MKKLQILLLALASCILHAEGPAGHYVLRGVMEVGSELVLNPNGSFEYIFSYGAADYSAKGTWRQDRGFVVLNTSGEAAPPFRLLRSAPGAEGIRVWIKAPNGEPADNIKVVLQTTDGEFEESNTAKGVATFAAVRSARAVTLLVTVYSVKGGPFELNPAHNDFTFEINGDAITQIRFKDERLKIDGRNLEMRFWNKTRPMHYEKR